MWGSMPLVTVSTTVIEVLQSAKVVHIPHESRSSLIAGYPLYRRVPLHTSGVCTWTSLQSCSMVFPSLQYTHWGFTGGVSSDHQGPLLRRVVLKGVHSLTHSFPSRWITRESTQSALPIGTPNKVLPHTTPGRTHIGSYLYYFHGWLLHEPVLRFGYDVYHRLPESTEQALNCQNPPNVVPNPSPQIPILHTKREQQWLIGWQ
jgi:hypothetical protein